MIDYQLNSRVKRTDLHERYGGRRQGGISPSKVSDNVFLITAPSGSQFGYIFDGPGTDGYFHYTGEGQNGDQQMAQGNRAVRDHRTEGRDLQLMRAHGTELEYLGQFEYVDHYEADAPEFASEDLRKVIVFRLKQISGGELPPGQRRVDRLGDRRVVELPIEQMLTERIVVEGNREPHEGERREQRLVERFVAYLEREGHDVCRLQLRPEGEAAPLFCDVFDKTTGTLYEAKGSVARQAIRMAIGQLADYGRLVSPSPRRAVLLPEKPREDLLRLLEVEGLTATWPGSPDFPS